MDIYESITYLEIKGRKPEILDRRFFTLDYEINDRDSFVYTRTRRVSRGGNSC